MNQRAKADPGGQEAMAVSSGHLVPDHIPMWIAKQWIVKYNGYRIIVLNGIPRKVTQMPIIEFLRERGFEVKVIWFSTPTKVCIERPYRPERADDTLESRIRRMSVYERETLPMRKELRNYGIAEAKGNLLCIDNSDLKKEDTAGMIIDHFRLPFEKDLLFKPGPEATSVKTIPSFAHRPQIRASAG